MKKWRLVLSWAESALSVEDAWKKALNTVSKYLWGKDDIKVMKVSSQPRFGDKTYIVWVQIHSIGDTRYQMEKDIKTFCEEYNIWLLEKHIYKI